MIGIDWLGYGLIAWGGIWAALIVKAEVQGRMGRLGRTQRRFR